ncbi:hypothetical protein [Micromonospora sicca]|nr:hypothetical protein [Micromonospora sp. 4G51]
MVSGVFPRTGTSNEEGLAAGVDLLTRVSDDDRRALPVTHHVVVKEWAA